MLAMSSKERMLTALAGGVPDRLPVTTHHVMPYFLEKYMPGQTNDDFFDHFGFDPITWVIAYEPDASRGEYFDPNQQSTTGFLDPRRVVSDEWRIEREELPDPWFKVERYTFVTPKGSLQMTVKTDDKSSMVTEYPIKEKKDIELLQYMTYPKCDKAAVARAAEERGDWGIVRGHIATFDVFGQPGCWQDAACLFGIENLILATYDDPKWVHTFLSLLQGRKKEYIRSLKGAEYDLLELGGGDASTTVISPKIFEEFVAPYDSELISLIHEAGQRVVYHTCGGMMPILEMIADMNPDAMETFTPPGMGGDVDLAEAKRRIGHRVCMIGGFDQYHYFVGCTPEETRKAVRRCFEAAGENGGYIIAPSDHFFDADLELIAAFTDEARKCTY